MKIQLLEQTDIDKIAAGEVVERPGSIVKELAENAIDAGANALTIEIRDGGISMIRVTDNGSGIAADEIRTAFLRHATSKIRGVEDLTSISSFGFRGEALSSIAAVSRVEMITKTRDALTGVRYRIEGGAEKDLEEIGAPDGTTIIVRDLFCNTPARRKFLKSDRSEGSHIADLVEKIALSHPEVSIKFMMNSQIRLSTSGNGSRKDVIFSAFGRETASNLLEIDETNELGMHLLGYIGKPVISRSSRAFEIFYVNGRLIHNTIMSKGLEEGYETFLMQHRFPFAVLYLEIDGRSVDVNVHPAKAQVRFSDGPSVFEFIKNAVRHALNHRELIIESTPLSSAEERQQEAEAARRAREAVKAEGVPEPFEKLRREHIAAQKAGGDSPYTRQYPDPAEIMSGQAYTNRAAGDKGSSLAGPSQAAAAGRTEETVHTQAAVGRDEDAGYTQADAGRGGEAAMQGRTEKKGFYEQASFLREDSPYAARRKSSPSGTGLTAAEMRLLNAVDVKDEGDGGSVSDNSSFLLKESRSRIRIIGQLFDTYWLMEYGDTFYIIDQHAAHEKVMYERLMKKYREKRTASQALMPQIIVTLTEQEITKLEANKELFASLGFVLEPFGGRDYAISAVPQDLYGMTEKEFFLEMLDNISEDTGASSIESVTAAVATMACKAAVKGNTSLSFAEAGALIDELMELENPYNCPHGRPTVISMTKKDIERKFKRIV